MTRKLSITTDAIPQLLWRIGVPSSIGMFFNTMFNFVDTYCAGLLSTNALAALSLTFPVFFTIVAIGSGLAQGTTVLLAHALGAGNQSDARRLFAQAVSLATMVGVVMTIIGLVTMRPLFEHLGATGEYLQAALAFIRVLLSGSTFFLLAMTVNTALAAQGETRIYRNFLIAGFILNCVLNPILMWGLFGLPALGVAGIASATIVIQIVGCIMLWWYVRKTDIGRDLSLWMFRPDVATLHRISAQVIPTSLNMLTIALGIFVFTWFTRQFGRETVAAAGIATRIEQAILMPVIGLSSAVLTIVGQNNGAGLPHRVRQAWTASIRIGVALMIFGGGLLWLFRGSAMRIFTHDPIIIAIGSEYLSVAAITLSTYPILFATVFLMQGLKRPAYGLWIGLYRQFLAPIIVVQLLAFVLGWGVWGIWWGICAINYSAALFALWWGWRAVSVFQRSAYFTENFYAA